MSEPERFTLTLPQESDYAFRIEFNDAAIPALHTDESPPLGGDTGPNASRLLVATVANCLSASLLFSLRKYKNTPGTIVTRAKAKLERNEQKRLHVAHIDLTIDLPETAGNYAQIERLLQQFENFCIVTKSVHQGVTVDVACAMQRVPGRMLAVRRDPRVAWYMPCRSARSKRRKSAHPQSVYSIRFATSMRLSEINLSELEAIRVRMYRYLTEQFSQPEVPR